MPLDGGTSRSAPSVVLGYYAQEQETLPAGQTPLEFVRSLKPITEQPAIGILRRLLFSYRDAQHHRQPERRRERAACKSRA